jgi:hypothetical protein
MTSNRARRAGYAAAGAWMALSLAWYLMREGGAFYTANAAAIQRALGRLGL